MDSLEIPYEVVDVTEPGHERERRKMQSESKVRSQQTTPLPPQFFNDDEYCGDYEDFDAANDDDKVKVLLRLEDNVPSDDDQVDASKTSESNN